MPEVLDRRPLLSPIVRRVRRVTRRLIDLDPRLAVPRPSRRPGERPTAALVGYYGWGNYGDELFHSVFEEHLAGGIDVAPAIGPEGRGARRINAAVRGSDAILIGGGDIVVPWSTQNRYFERSFLRRPVFIAGVGVPGWRKPEPATTQSLAAFFRHPSVRFVAARDDESSAWITTHLRPSVDVRTSPDLVCGLSLPAVERPADPPVLGVVVRSRQTPDDLSHVRRLCLRAVELGYRVRRIVLATGIVRARDLQATRSLDVAASEIVESDDLEALTRAIGECTVLASMKFHGTVVATMYGVPSIVLMPTDKSRNFLRRIGREDLRSAYSDPALPERITRDVTPIDPVAIAELRAGASELLEQLRLAMVEATTED